jgi:hypothetical protein
MPCWSSGWLHRADHCNPTDECCEVLGKVVRYFYLFITGAAAGLACVCTDCGIRSTVSTFHKLQTTHILPSR